MTVEAHRAESHDQPAGDAIAIAQAAFSESIRP
jgi:hypothetical protein